MALKRNLIKALRSSNCVPGFGMIEGHPHAVSVLVNADDLARVGRLMAVKYPREQTTREVHTFRMNNTRLLIIRATDEVEAGVCSVTRLGAHSTQYGFVQDTEFVNLKAIFDNPRTKAWIQRNISWRD